jgi:hypothetical protein
MILVISTLKCFLQIFFFSGHQFNFFSGIIKFLSPLAFQNIFSVQSDTRIQDLKDFSALVISHGKCNFIMKCGKFRVIYWFMERIQFGLIWHALLNQFLYSLWLHWNAFIYSLLISTISSLWDFTFCLNFCCLNWASQMSIIISISWKLLVM